LACSDPFGVKGTFPEWGGEENLGEGGGGGWGKMCCRKNKSKVLIFNRGVPLLLSTGQHVLGSSERKICRLFFLEEVPPPLSTGWQVLRTHLSEKQDFLENTPSQGR